MAGEKNSHNTNWVRDINKLCLFEDFVRSRYLPYVQQNKRSWKTDERYLNRHILPYLGNCPLSEISEERLRGWLSSLENNGLSPSSQYRLFWLVKYILNFAVRLPALQSIIDHLREQFPLTAHSAESLHHGWLPQYP